MIVNFMSQFVRATVPVISSMTFLEVSLRLFLNEIYICIGEL